MEKEKIPVAKGLIENQDGEFLMLKKAEDYDFTAGKWEQPGGKIEEGEDRFEALKREIKEETGLEIEGSKDLVRIEIEDENHINCYVMHSSDFSGEIELSDEHEKYNWVRPEEFSELEWHRDSAYILPPGRYSKKYLEEKRNYGSGMEIAVVKALIQDEKGNFLAVKKSVIEKISSGQRFKKYGDMSGKWELPGGRVGKRKDENRFEALKRELKEELDIEVSGGTDIVREEIEEENTVDVYIILLRPDDWNGEVVLSDEHEKYNWVRPEEYFDLDWHKDAGYGYSPMAFLDEYLEMNLNHD
ncbi:MAG: 8-oxo-dGTP diphosphatase [Candidatus Nanohaloarchaea archaeon]|jgi:8-oxo-dGTP diphosphatase